MKKLSIEAGECFCNEGEEKEREGGMFFEISLSAPL